MSDKLTFASFYIDTPAATVLSPNTPAKAAGTTIMNTVTVGKGFTMPQDNRLQLDAGQATRVYRVAALVSMVKSSGGDTDGSLYIAKNGVVIAESGVIRTMANTTDYGSVAASTMTELAAGDYVEIWIETNNGDDVTVQAGGMGIQVMG